MKIKEQLNRESSYYTVGLNVFSLVTAVLTWAHLTDHLTWWALPLTITMGMIAFGCEIQSRDKKAVRF